MNPRTMAYLLLITYAVIQDGRQVPSDTPLFLSSSFLPYPQPGSLLPFFGLLSVQNPLSMELTCPTMAPTLPPSDMDVERPPDQSERVSTKANGKMMAIKPHLPDSLLALAVTPYSSLHGPAPNALFDDLHILTHMVMKIVLE